MREHKYKSADLHLGPKESELEDGCDKDGNWVSDRIRGLVYLNHQCDEWLIGGKEEVGALIADLQKILKYLGGDEA